MAEKPIDLGLTALDELFMTDAQRHENKLPRIRDIPLDQIDDMPNHPYKVRMDEDMEALTESVRTYGIITPVILRKKEDGRFECAAGHRRRKAAELAGHTTIRAEVREMTRDEAIILMVDSNLQRTTILPSEKAFSYKMRLEAMKRQGKRNDLTLSPVATKLDSASSIGENAGDSRDQVYRYIRLTNLTPELLQLVDDGRMAMRPAVELSYLTEKEQQDLYELIELEECTPSHAQAIKMRKFSQMQQLTPEVILSILQETKPNQKEKFQIPRDRISKFFKPGTPAQNIEDTIVKALELYRKRQREQNR